MKWWLVFNTWEGRDMEKSYQGAKKKIFPESDIWESPTEGAKKTIFSTIDWVRCSTKCASQLDRVERCWKQSKVIIERVLISLRSVTSKRLVGLWSLLPLCSTDMQSRFPPTWATHHDVPTFTGTTKQCGQLIGNWNISNREPNSACSRYTIIASKTEPGPEI